MKPIHIIKIKSKNGNQIYFHWSLWVYGREIILFSIANKFRLFRIMAKELHRSPKNNITHQNGM